MKYALTQRPAADRGFTLVETVITMVVLAIASVAIISLQGNIFNGQSGGRKMEIGAQLMQGCAEQMLATRRAIGYGATALAPGSPAAAATASCSGLAIGSYAAPVVTITAGNSATITGCPSAAASSCKLVSITQGGLTPVSLMLSSY